MRSLRRSLRRRLMRSRRGSEAGEEAEAEARGKESVSLQLGSPTPPSRVTAEVEALGGAAPRCPGRGELSSSKVTKQLELASISAAISAAARGVRLPPWPIPRAPLRSCAAARVLRAVLASVRRDSAEKSPRSTPGWGWGLGLGLGVGVRG
jgi:hypothetical protein